MTSTVQNSKILENFARNFELDSKGSNSKNIHERIVSVITEKKMQNGNIERNSGLLNSDGTISRGITYIHNPNAVERDMKCRFKTFLIFAITGVALLALSIPFLRFYPTVSIIGIACGIPCIVIATLINEMSNE